MATQTVNELSTAYLTVTCKDKAGVLAVPASVSYRIDCLTTGVAIRPLTALVPASEIEIKLAPADNTMQLAGNVEERRLLTLQASYGAGDGVNSEYEYLVKNLRKV